MLNVSMCISIYSRSQTTKGVWIAKCVGIEPCTIAMDLEGTDGRERGEVISLLLKSHLLFFGEGYNQSYIMRRSIHI